MTVVNARDPAWAGGAVGDGVTDDTAAIQAAMDAVAAVGGGDVVLPATRWATGYLVSTLRYASGVRIRGAGMHGSSIVQKGGTADFLFKNNNPAVAADNVQISDLFLNGFLNQGSSLGGIDFQNAVFARAERVWVDGFAGSSIRYKGGNGGGDTMYGSVVGCFLTSMPAGGIGVELQSSAASQPDGTNILDTLVNAISATTAFKIVGTASRGADSCLIEGCRTMVTSTVFDSDGTTTRLIGNRFEVITGNMALNFHPSFGNTSPGGFLTNNTFALPGTFTITDSGTLPVRRTGNLYPAGKLDYNGSSSTQTPGVTATVNIAHGLVSTPSIYNVNPGDANARGAPSMFVTADATNIILNFSGNLTGATSYTWRWQARVT